jgi:hypothetical protein
MARRHGRCRVCVGALLERNVELERIELALVDAEAPRWCRGPSDRSELIAHLVERNVGSTTDPRPRNAPERAICAHRELPLGTQCVDRERTLLRVGPLLIAAHWKGSSVSPMWPDLMVSRSEPPTPIRFAGTDVHT